jgi:hypothetical protein
MTNPNTVPDDEQDPLRRSATPGEPQDSLEASQRQGWREKYPGWETIHGKPNDPRFKGKLDPNTDIRFNTNLNTSATLPRRAGLAFWVWLVVIGIVLMVLMAYAFYIRYPKKAPRSPEQTQIDVQPMPVRNVNLPAANLLGRIPARDRRS